MHITIIGAGPGGYETAVAAAERGIKVTIVSGGPVGGTCLNEGCIPTKTFCRNAEILENLQNAPEFGIETGDVKFDFSKALERKDAVISQLRSGVEFLLKHKNITLIYGKASLKDSNTVTVEKADGECEEISADHIIIAVGSVSASLPVPGADLEGVINSTELLSLAALPKKLCIIGAGVIGLEFASIFKSFGSDVTVVEYCKDILPRFDADLAKRLKQSLTKRGIAIETSAQVEGISECTEDGHRLLNVKYLKKDKEYNISADKVLMAVGRRPAAHRLNLADLNIEFSAKGVVTDANMRTNIPNIFAIGDIRGGMMLAHAAVFEGKRALSAIIADEKAGAVPGTTEFAESFVKEIVDDGIELGIIPAAVFTYPEAAVVGMTEEDCKAKGVKCKCFKSFFRANGKAVAMAEPEGYCKIIVADNVTDNVAENQETSALIPGQILGCHLFGAHASDIVQEIAALMNKKATIGDLRNIVHAHPTLTEVLLNAAGN